MSTLLPNTSKRMNNISFLTKFIAYLFLGIFCSLQSFSQNNTLDFDGVDDYVTIPRVIAGDFTYEYWLKTTKTSPSGTHWYEGVGIVDGEVGGVVNDFGTSLLNNKLAFGTGNPDVTITSTTSVNTGSWVHVAVTRTQSNGAIKIYINGILEASGTGGTNSLISSSILRIGVQQSFYGGYLSGNIDELRFWNVVKTASEIQANMFNTVSNSATGLVAYYNFNAGTAAGTNTGLTTLTDQTANANNGTLTNFALTGATSNWVNSSIFNNSNADLSGLSTNVGTFTPAFAAETTTYTMSLVNSTTSITVIPTSANANTNIQVRVNGGSYATITSGNASNALALNVGSNTINVLVTSQDATTTKTYTITVTRAQTPPTITSFSPQNAKPGDVVTITGNNFNTTANNNIVFFGATKATVTAATATSITTIVPSGATFAPISVLNTSTVLAASSSARFNPIYAPAKTGITANEFLPKHDFTPGTNPYSVAIGDLDGDGKPDLVVTNNSSFSNSISIFRNTSSNGNLGADSFADKVDFTTGVNPISVAIGDLDGDGKLDLAVVNQGANSISIFHNTSTIGSIDANSFAAKVDLTTGSSPTSVAIGDLDGDGKLDLAVANSASSSVSTFLNISAMGILHAGSFTAKVDFGTGDSPNGIAIGDLDGDGKPDLATVNRSSYDFSILRNISTNGSISFSANVDFSTSSNPRSIAIGDLDGDGKLDLAVVGFNAFRVAVYRNTSSNGSITFDAGLLLTTGNDPLSIAIGDLDGDSKPDLAVANSRTNHSISVFRNTSTSGSIVAGSFAARVDFSTGASSGPRFVAIGDLNGDGRPELVSANTGSDKISVIRNASNNADLSALTTTAGAISPTFSPTTTAYTATAHSNASITVTPTAAEEFATNIKVRVNGGSYATVTTGNASNALALNFGSNTIDVLVTAQDGNTTKTYTITVNRTDSSNAELNMLTTTAGTLTPSFTPTTTTYTATVNYGTSSVTVTPTVARENATVKARVNGGTYSTVTNATPSNALALNVGSNTIDVLVTALDDTTTKNYTITVTRGFAIPTITSFTPSSAKPGDVVTITGTNFVATPTDYIVYFGATKATVTAATATSLTVTVPTGATHAPITVVYTVGNLIGQSMTKFNPIFAPPNNGIATNDFATGVEIATLVNSNADAFESGDLDGDGKIDIVIANTSSNSISVFRNTSTVGSISFAASQDYVTGSYPSNISIADLDGDGKLDIVVANLLQNTVSILRNTSIVGSCSLAPKVDVSIPQTPVSVAIGDIDLDGKPDLVVGGMYNLVTYKNTGTVGSISFALDLQFGQSGYAYSIAIGDLDGDNKPDIAAVIFDQSFD